MKTHSEWNNTGYNSAMNLRTPLRYPGGKRKLADFMARLISSNGLNGCDYVEPYAGGAGLAIELPKFRKVCAKSGEILQLRIGGPRAIPHQAIRHQRIQHHLRYGTGRRDALDIGG